MTKAQTANATVAANPFEALTKPAAKKPAKQSLAKTTVEKKTAASKPEKKTAAKVTKKSQAVTFYKKNIKKGKSIVIDFFKGDLSMTDAGANSYFYAIKKELSTAAAA